MEPVKETIDVFLRSVFNNKPKNEHILIWTNPGKASYWFTDVEHAIDSALAYSKEGKEIYIGVGTTDEDVSKWKDGGLYKRAKKENVTCLYGLWGDIDYKCEDAHAKSNLPPTENDALELVYSMPVEPTMVIHSGHGIQAWWLFKTPYKIYSQPERAKAEALSHAWNMLLKQKAGERLWDVDSVYDIARVLRVGGTLNYKNKKDIRPVNIMSRSGKRYDIDNLRAELKSTNFDVEEVQANDEYLGNIIVADDFKLDPKAEPPWKKLVVMSQLDPKFQLSIEHNRPKREFQDQSPSAYDFSIAIFCAQAGWSNQEIVDTLIYTRKKNNCDLKLRPSYYRRTLQKVWDKIRAEQALEDIEDLTSPETLSADADFAEGDGSIEENERQQILDALSRSLKIKINNIIKYTGDPPQYRIETNCGNALLGEVRNLISQSKFKENMAALTGVYIRAMKGKEWDKIAELLLKAVVEESIGDEATNDGLAKSWVMNFIHEKSVAEDACVALDTGKPFIDGNSKLCIIASSFTRWLRYSENEKISPRQLGAVLRGFGAKPVTKSFKGDEGKSTSRSVWVLPGDAQQYVFNDRAGNMQEARSVVGIEI